MTERPAPLAAPLLPVAPDAVSRWIAGAAMLLAPPMLVAAVLLRFDHGLLYPRQLAAYAESPARVTWSYGLFALGTVLLFPAVAAIARRVAVRHRGWAI